MDPKEPITEDKRTIVQIDESRIEVEVLKQLVSERRRPFVGV
jgi:hypothetical protein